MAKSVSEPNFRQACQWWPDLPNIWTPLGWPEHQVRFSVFWNGTLFAQPCLNNRTKHLDSLGAQFTFAPHYTEWPGLGGHSSLAHDDGMLRQGWNDGTAPVLWTEWSQDGLLLRQEAFAHIPGGGPTVTGDEPLFAWVRLSVHSLCPVLPLEDLHGFHILIQAPHAQASMSTRNQQCFDARAGRYPRALAAETAEYTPAGLRILEEDGTVRMAVAPGQTDCAHAGFTEPADAAAYYDLYVQMPAVKGAHIDLLIPMLPCGRAVFDRELAQGYDTALAEADAFWAETTQSPTRFEVPEREINEAIRQSIRFSHVLAERNPDTGKLCKLSGSWVYSALWTTPGAMDMVMLMDTMGRHGAVERWLEIFKDEQGTVVPPGDAYELHPGFLSTPALYKSIDWLSDNGAVLWTLAMHALLSGDAAYVERFADVLVKSCDWIKEARAKTGHGGYEGVLPPAVATDKCTKIQALWSVGWNYKGLTAAVRVLKGLKHPRAAEFAREAKDSKEAFLAALRDKCAKMPTWKDTSGKRRVLVPTALAGDEKEETRHAFYLDTGPLFPVFAGLMDAGDPLMDDVRAWFREGPQTKLYRRDANCWQVPVLDREMSSCEPCYSWNVFHNWQLGDRPRFLEGMYSLFAGALSRQTWTSCETRGGITGTVFAAPLAIYLARLAVVDDQLKEGELHLLRLAPLAWLKPGDRCRFDRLPTEFGPVTLRTRVPKNGKTLSITWRPAFRAKPKKVVLHIPAMPGLQTVLVNGEAVHAKGGKVTLKAGKRQ
jgi:hypothetical protein